MVTLLAPGRSYRLVAAVVVWVAEISGNVLRISGSLKVLVELKSADGQLGIPC